MRSPSTRAFNKAHTLEAVRRGRGRLCRRLRALTGAACARAQLTFNNTLTYYYSEDAWMGCKFFQDTVRASTAGVQDFPDARVG
jgi:hypothetical protein